MLNAGVALPPGKQPLGGALFAGEMQERGLQKRVWWIQSNLLGLTEEELSGAVCPRCG